MAVALASVPFVTCAAAACASDADCSLNGACSRGACACDPGWTGPACGTLDLGPANLSQGYNLLRGGNASTSSWGATQ
eukprot:gene36023-41691_t